MTVLISDAASGQSSILFKLAALKQDSVLVQYGNSVEKSGQSIAPKLFNFEMQQARSVAEIVSFCRKAKEENKAVFIDFRNQNKDAEETKHFIEGLRRGFQNVEVLICLSAIHSELYNNKEINKFEQLADGLIVSHMDLCLTFFLVSSKIYNSHGRQICLKKK